MPDREDVSFDSGGSRCAAWLYRPEGEGPHPYVVLAHGFGGTRLGRLGAYAERFRDAGLAALVFDYRHFGDSEGEPRQLLSVGRQLDDWRAAIAYARELEDVDSERIALWGTSFSGGHCVKLAAEDERIAAVVSQVPFTDGVGALRAAGPAQILRLSVAGVIDGLAGLTGGDPQRIPIVAPPGKGAAMNQPGAYDGYRGIYDDPDADFRNEVCGRAMLTLGLYAPALDAARVQCPLLVCVAPDDAVTPAAPARAMADRAPRGELFDFGPGPGHFDVYGGDLFERGVAAETAFLLRSLRVTEPAAAA
jgi:cephalosporin-C deacetylase-like acetyl esterase